MKRFVLALVATAGLVLSALPASASASEGISGLRGASWVTTPNGVVGVQQTVILRATKLRGRVATFTFTNAGTGTNAGQAAVNSAGFAYLPWTPNVSGVWTITATSGGSTVDQTSIVVAAVPTTTTLLSVGEVQQGVASALIAEVRALAGSITPSGTIAVRTSTGAIAATGTLNPSGTPGLATVTMNWTPAPQTVALTAVYTPDSNAFQASTSSSIVPAVGPAQAVSLRIPPALYVGVPAQISSVVSANALTPEGGSQAFNLSIEGFTFFVLGGSQPIIDGVSTITWTPTQAGFQTINVQYASSNFAINGRDSQAILVQPAPTPDSITTTPTGAPAWGPGLVGTLTQGSYVQVTPQSISGNPVTLTPDGPCAIEGGIVTVLGPGTCSITAASMGNGANLAPTEVTYTINVVKPPRKKASSRR